MRIYEQLQSKIDLSVRKLGTIYIASNDQEQQLINELHLLNRQSGYASELWTQQQCLDRYPCLRREYCVAGLYFPDEVSVNPRLMIHRLHRFLAEQPNYQSRFQCAVTGISNNTDTDTVRVTTAGDDVFQADRAIICSGIEFQLLFPQLFTGSGMQSVKLQMLRLKPQTKVYLPGNILTGLSIRRYESFAQCPSWNEIKRTEPSDAPWKKWGIHLLFKQEIDGGIIVGDSHEYASAADPSGFDHELRTDINDYLIQEARKIVDLPSWDIESAWYGVYCQTDHPSGIFRHSISPNIEIITGIGGKGMTSSAGYAKQVLGEMYDD